MKHFTKPLFVLAGSILSALAVQAHADVITDWNLITIQVSKGATNLNDGNTNPFTGAALNTNLAPIACASETEYVRCTCPDEEHCGLRMLMIDVRNAIANILDKYTLGDVVEVTLRKMKRDKTPMPFGASRTDSERPKRRNADPAAGFLTALGISTSGEGISSRKAR
jgi:hypothetical protein